jgi:hypothetical protein
VNEAEGPPNPWITWFEGWVNSTDFQMVARGFSTAQLGIFHGGFSMFSTKLERKLHGWDRIDYQWPVVVIEIFRPTRMPALLIDFKGALGLCGIQGNRKEVKAALAVAGLEVVEVSVRGWDTPLPVPRELIGDLADKLPRCVVARSHLAIKSGGWRRES